MAAFNPYTFRNRRSSEKQARRSSTAACGYAESLSNSLKRAGIVTPVVIVQAPVIVL